MLFLDPYMLGYRVGWTLIELMLVASGSTAGLSIWATIKVIAKTHALVDKSDEAISKNLFDCLDYIDY